MKKFFFSIIVLLSIILFSQNSYSSDKIRIALSKGSGGSHYQNYYNWLTKAEPNIEIIDMYKIERNDFVKILSNCQGILFTGGDDIAPGRYGQANDSTRCSIDYKRDTLEFELYKTAVELKLPILGICRGEQLMAVATGGSLVIDIPQDIKNHDSHQCELSDTCFHRIKIESNSFLGKICGTTDGFVATNHHQSANKISSELKASSYGIDGVIESIEWKNPKDKNFLLGVQWHPEKMKYEDPCSGNIAKYFIEAAKKYKKNK